MVPIPFEMVGIIPNRLKLTQSVDISSVLVGSAFLFSRCTESAESGSLGVLAVGYLERRLFRTQAWTSGCRVAKHTVIMAVPASTKVRTANSFFGFKSITPISSPGTYRSRTREMTLAPVARKIRKYMQHISPIGMRRSLVSIGRHARTKIQSHAAFTAILTYSRGLTMWTQSIHCPGVLALTALTRFETVGTPHWKALTNM
jgi:hypothetical protein